MNAIKIFLLMFSCSSMALPILNESAATNSYVTFYPDHEDPNLYYFAPNKLGIMLDDSGIPLFNYIAGKSWGKHIASVTVILDIGQFRNEIEVAKANVLAGNSAAKFAPLPLKRSRVSIGENRRFISWQQCEHTTGRFEDPVGCSFGLKSKGAQTVLKMLKNGQGTLNLSFEYRFSGLEVQADGSLEKARREFSVQGLLGGEVLSRYPQLFRDRSGHLLD